MLRVSSSAAPPLLALVFAFAATTEQALAQGNKKQAAPPTAQPQVCTINPPTCPPPTYGVVVNPKGTSVSQQANSTGHTGSFTVKNTGSTSNSYSFTCTSTGPVACTSVSPTSATLGAGSQSGVTVIYSVAAPGSGTLKLSASGANASDNGSYNVTVATFQVAVAPDGATAQQRLANTTGYSETFTVQNTGTGQDTYTFTCAGAGQVTCTGVNPSTVSLTASASTTVTASYSVGFYGTGTLKLTASGIASDTGWYTVPVYGGPPVVDSTPYLFVKQDYSRCAQACFAVTHSYATVPYFSLNAPRNVSLVYNSDRANPRPFVRVNVTPSPTYPGTPAEYRLQVQVGGVTVTFVNGDSILRFTYPGNAAARLGGQFDASGYATGVYPMTITASALYGTNLFAHTINTKLVVVNEATNSVARGWVIGAVQRLYPQADGSALITEGDGSATYFLKSGSGFATPAGEFTSLRVNGSSGWVRNNYPDGTQVVFDNAGRLIQIIGRFGNAGTISYDASGRVSQIKDPLNLAITLNYGANGLSSIVDPVGRSTVVTVDGSRRLIAIADPDMVSTGFGYDANLRLSTITNRQGVTTTLGYDLGWKLASVTAPTVQLYDGTTASPVTTYGAWQDVSVPYASTAATPFTTVLAGTDQGLVTDPGGHLTQFTVNQWGSPVQTLDPLNRFTIVTYDGNGLPIKTSYPSGSVDSAAYDSRGRVAFSQTGGLSGTTIGYDLSYGQVISTSGTGRPTAQSFVDAGGRIVQTVVGNGPPTTYTYDGRGRMLTQTDPAGHLVVQHTYGGVNGNLSRDSVPGNRVTTYLYDAYGRDTAVQRPGMRMRITHYDIINRPTQVYDSINATPTVTVYDSLYVRRVSDPKGQVYAFTYNALGWVTQRIDPAGRANIFAYDREGLLRRWTNRRGDTLSYAYDVLHRQITKSGRNTTSEGWSYSTDGRVFTATSPVATVTGYLSLSGVTDSARTIMAGQTFWRRYRYTVAGLLDSVDISGGGIAFKARKYVYNAALGTLTEIHVGGAITRVAPNKDAQDSTTTFPAGDQVTRLYYPLHGVAQIGSNAPYSASISRSIGYDSVGRVTRQVGSGKATAYSYDMLGRLAAESLLTETDPTYVCQPQGQQLITDSGNNCVSQGGWHVDSVHSFLYDAVGNRTDNGGSYVTGNRLTAFAGCTYNTDNDGNVVSRTCGNQMTTLFWSAESRLDSVAVGTVRVAFKYDAGGRLTRKDLNGAPENYFLWDGGTLLAELGVTGMGTPDEVSEYSYWDTDRPHAQLILGQENNAHQDGLGNIMALTDGTQALMRSYTFDAFGNLTGGSDVRPFLGTDRVRWKGALWLGPEADFYYMRNRWYEPKSGRFLSEDPTGLAGGINPYIFAAGDPVNGADPTGLASSNTHCLMVSQYVHCGGGEQAENSDNAVDFIAMMDSYMGMVDALNMMNAASSSAPFQTWDQVNNFINSAYDIMAQTGIDDISSEMGSAEWSPSKYTAPDLVKVNGWFHVDFTDQDSNLHIFKLLDAVFERIGPVSDKKDGAYATYRIVCWEEEASNNSEYLFWVNFIPIRSQLQGSGPWYNVRQSQFVQMGRAGGLFVNLP
jgi:RHS repeat-associated protein